MRMKSFNDFLVNDGVCSVLVVAGFVRIIKRDGAVDTVAASAARPRDISDLLVAWSFISDYVECVEFVSQGIVLCSVSDVSFFRPVWSVSLPA